LTVGQRFSIGLAGAYSYAPPDGDDEATNLVVPVLLLSPRRFDPTTDPRVQPGSLVCSVESIIIAWHRTANPPPSSGAYIFNLSVYGFGQTPIYTATLRYAVPPDGVASQGCR
jgi:hypothetical protein